MNPIKPMLAVSGQPFSREGWIFEPKIDGTRCIASAQKRVLLSNRRLADITYRYPELASALGSLQGECVLDGEITVFKKGIPNFRSLAERDHQNDPIRIDYLSRAMPASYVVFDILSLDKESLIHLPLKERKRILFRELEADLKDSETVTLIDSFPEKGEDYFQAALKNALFWRTAPRRLQPGRAGVHQQSGVGLHRRGAAGYHRPLFAQGKASVLQSASNCGSGMDRAEDGGAGHRT
ncbi:hypothetical protein, partial [Methanothrix sp.]|uniref:ATP-dependent DNA ligase n=1 Tax=Methanothrix sp. TaxID=90426 RepID=UPI002355C886